MYIIDQDREHTYHFNGNLATRPAIFDGKVMGINLYSDNNFLGTFDSPQEALNEMNRILTCKRLFCWVSGYAGWEAWGAVKGAMQDAD